MLFCIIFRVLLVFWEFSYELRQTVFVLTETENLLCMICFQLSNANNLNKFRQDSVIDFYNFFSLKLV